MFGRHCLQTMYVIANLTQDFLALIENRLFFLIWLKIQMYLVHPGTHMLRFFKILSIGHSSNFYWRIFVTVKIHLCAGSDLTKTRSFILSSCHWEAFGPMTTHLTNHRSNKQKKNFDRIWQWQNASLCRQWPDHEEVFQLEQLPSSLVIG